MRIPSKVKVGYMIYDVVITPDPIILENRQCAGMIDYENGVIKLSDGNVQGEFARHQSFWHELFHAFTRERGLKFEDEENVVDEFGKALAAFFIDNNLSFESRDDDATSCDD